MAEYEKIWEKSIPAEHGGVTYSASIRVRLHGKWSGNMTTGTPQSQDDRTFKLKITGSYTRATVPTQSGEMWTSEDWYCFQNDPNADGAIIYAICVDELYNKWVGNDTDGNLYLPFLRRARQLATASEVAEYYAACEEITETGSYPGTATDLILQYITMADTSDMCLTSARLNPTAGLQWCYNIEYDVETDLPIFETEAQLMNYINSNGEDTSDIINIDEDPEEDYENSRKYKYAWNIYGHNANNSTQFTGYRNYRFYGGDGKICFYRVTPSESSPYTVKLYHYQNYVIKAAGVHDTNDDDFETISNPELYFLSKSIQFSDNNFYTRFKFSTDLLVFGSEAQAQMWVDDLIDARAAENFNEVSRAYNEIIDPGYGNPETGNDNGINGQSYVHGARLWVMSSSELNHFFDDIFDPVHISDILDGTQLLGDGINAVQGISYFPIDIDDVATVNGTADSIKIGSYTCPTATGRYVWNNNKMIDCGSLFIAPVYNDFRDYKIKLYIYLPYCGFHCLDPISKYMGKNLSVKYAVDITTGGCTAYVYADDIFLGDSYDGFMASQRPLTALDQTAYLNAVMGCVSSIATRETGMINSATEGIAGAASGKVSGGVGPGGALNISMGAFGDLYKLSQAVKDTPMRTRGGFAGCLGFFGNQKIHIITAQAKTVKPTLEQPLVGYPSHVSQNVGQFSGYLKCSYFKMADGFNGTLEELKEIIEMMQGGVYL